MPTRAGAVRRIHRCQLWIAAGAVVAAAPGLLFALDSYVGGLFVFTVMSIVVPLFLTRNPRAFTRVCVTIGLVLGVLSVLGVMLGMFVFLPSAVLLLLAAGADPRKRPVAARVLGAVGGLVLAGAVAGSGYLCWQFYVSPALAQPHTYRAVIDSAGSSSSSPSLSLLDAGSSDTQNRLRTSGATDIWISEAGGGEVSYLEVRFSDELSESQRAVLKAQVAGVPGVSHVELCSVRDCG